MRVLVVEDEPKISDVLQRGLARSGLAVDVVKLGEDAPHAPGPRRPRRLPPAGSGGHRAWRGDTLLDLSAKELAMLELFMRHPGQVLSFTLLEHACEGEYENLSNVVDAFVRLLREKIDRPYGHASLQTVRGLGYRLCDT